MGVQTQLPAICKEARMDEYRDETYGEQIAGIYDEWYGGVDEADLSVLKELAGHGKALELGIGTGRMAVPLKQSGVEVHGIDASPAMVAKMRAKPGGADIPVAMGDFAEVPIEGQFDLVYILFNTFFALLTQDDQVRCFQNVARHLTPNGVFLVEAFVPDLHRFQGDQAVRAVEVGVNLVRLDVSEIDILTQKIVNQHVLLNEKGLQLYPVQIRYVWPSELDLMARLAGMRLKHRWGGFRKEAFTTGSKKHISVYQLISA
jgi:SAM-dependent methyltransferase